MSDDLDNNDAGNREPGGKGKNEESDFDKDLKKSPLAPVNQDLCDFIESLFEGEGDFPEKIEARTVKGRNKDQYGVIVFQKIYSSGSKKPSYEQIVMLSNKIIHRVRVHTDVQQRESHFMVGAMHHGRSDDYFEVMTLTVKPRKTYKNGIDGDAASDDDEDFATKYNIAQLGHQNDLFRLIGGMLEGLVDRSDRQVSALADALDRERARSMDLFEVNMRLVQNDDERKERAEKSKMWRENIDKGLGMAWGLLPTMLPSKSNGAWQPGTESSEAYILRESFFKTTANGGPLTQEQFEIICGKVDPSGERLVEEGALSIEQVQLMAQVAKKEINPDRLEELLPGGPLEIKNEQMVQALKAGVPPAALAPLKAMFDARMAKRAEKGE